MHSHRLSFVLALCLGATACGSSVSEEEFLPTVAENLCSLQQQCDCQTSLTEEQCRAFVVAGLGQFLVPPDNAGLTYDADCAGEAVDTYGSLGCGTGEDLFTDPLASCHVCKIYHGDKAEGAACTAIQDTALDDCAQGLMCFDGKCQDPCVPAQEGEACLSRQCADGLVCTLSLEDGSSACKPAAGLGESCDSVSCEGDLVCDFETVKCKEPPGTGEPCDGTCAEGSWCDTSSTDSSMWVCKDPKADGEACQGDDECVGGDCDFDTQKCKTRGPLVCEIQPN